MKYLGCLSLHCYRAFARVTSKVFSLLVAGAFSHFGRGTTLTLPARISGEKRIAIGDRVFIGAGSWLQTLSCGDNKSIAIHIGSGTSIVGDCVISSVKSVRLEEEVLIARNVYISDHIHRYTQIERSVMHQGVDKVIPVLIKRGAWLGQNVVVCPGVTIGRGAVIGANSVVTQDVPDFSVAVGAPARVVKLIETSEKQSEHTAGAGSRS